MKWFTKGGTLESLTALPLDSLEGRMWFRNNLPCVWHERVSHPLFSPLWGCVQMVCICLHYAEWMYLPILMVICQKSGSGFSQPTATLVVFLVSAKMQQILLKGYTSHDQIHERKENISLLCIEIFSWELCICRRLPLLLAKPTRPLVRRT